MNPQQEQRYRALHDENRALVESGRCDNSLQGKRCRPLENNKVKKAFSQEVLDYYVVQAEALLRLAHARGMEQITLYVLNEDRAVVKPFKDYWDDRAVFCRIEECHHACKMKAHAKSCVQMYPPTAVEQDGRPHTDIMGANEAGF